MKDGWEDRCLGGLCPDVSVALTNHGFTIPSTTTLAPITTTTTTLASNLLRPPPKSGQCPTTSDEIRENNGCCPDFGDKKCQDNRICLSGGCYATGMRGKLQWTMRPCSLGLCPAPSQILAHNGETLWEPKCPETEMEIKQNGGCIGRQNRLCRTGGCFDARFADACKAGLCPAVKDALKALQDVLIE